MVQASIILAAHNEGDLLRKTVAACHDTCAGLEYEIIVADDASEDDSVRQLWSRFPDQAVHESTQRLGVSPTKDRGAEHATGEVLVFLDAHCKPEAGAIAQLVNDVHELDGEAIVTPTVAQLDPVTWINNFDCTGHGYMVELENISWRWISAESLRPFGPYYESPTVIGCCLAISKMLYETLWGFDRNMYMWGIEDVDFGVRSWLLGYPVLHEPRAVIGHRFQSSFASYTAPPKNLIANKLRMAYKILPPQLWAVWLPAFRGRQRADVWHDAWDIFTLHRGTAEVERVHLAQRQKCDVVSYARRFGLKWPSSPNHTIAQEHEELIPIATLSG
jgi:GT2 family glycosyltransferase